MAEIVKVYMAKHKETGQPWVGRKTVYEAIGGLKAAMSTSWRAKMHHKSYRDEYNIYSYELKEGVLEE